MDIPAAVNYGYRLPPPPQEASDRITRANRLTPAEEKAAFGTDGQKGCYQKAHQKIAGSDAEVDLKLFNTLNRNSLQESKKDPEVERTIAAWSKCMEGSGHTYADPFDAAGDPKWRKEKTATEEEKDTATADVRCKQKVNLIAIWANSEYSLQEEYIRQNASYFSQIKSSKKEQLENIGKVL